MSWPGGWRDDDARLLSRVEDAGINACAPREQRWTDGWIVRASPGKAKRARCINAVAEGRLPLAQRLALAQAVYREAGLPMLVRITPFTRPALLEAELAARGYASIDDTRVMVCRQLPAPSAQRPELPPGFGWRVLDARGLAQAVGALRGSPPAQTEAQAQRLAASPVPFRGLAIVDEEAAGDAVVACGQAAREGDLVGVYDVFTAPAQRNRGWARMLCDALLAAAAADGARCGYLQCEADNAAARRIYSRLRFVDAYAYHYRQAPDENGDRG